MKIYADLCGDTKKARDKKPSQLTKMMLEKQAETFEQIENINPIGGDNAVKLSDDIDEAFKGKGTHLY